MLALDLGTQGETLRVADLGCGLLPLLEDFRSLAESCRIKRLEYCGLEMEGGVAKEACEVQFYHGERVDVSLLAKARASADASQTDATLLFELFLRDY